MTSTEDLIEQTRETNQGPVATISGGSGDDLYLFIHGLPGFKEEWTALMRPASERGRVLAPDMPGYGATPAPAGWSFRHERYADISQALVEGAGAHRVHLILHDFGGSWGLEWALRDLARVASVTLIDTGLLVGYRWHWFARILQTPILGELFQAVTTRSAFARLSRYGGPKLPATTIDQIFDRYTSHVRRSAMKTYRAERDIAHWSVHASERFRSAGLPCLVLWGAKDPFLPPRFAQAQKQPFPNSEIHILSNVGHWPHLEAPETVMRRAGAFWDLVSAGPLHQDKGSP